MEEKSERKSPEWWGYSWLPRTQSFVLCLPLSLAVLVVLELGRQRQADVSLKPAWPTEGVQRNPIWGKQQQQQLRMVGNSTQLLLFSLFFVSYL